jgi:integrase/recombinase XerD
MNLTVTIIHDTRRTKTGNKYPVKLRITFMRQQKYYPIGIDLTKEEFVLVQSPIGSEKQLSLKIRRWFNEMRLKCDSVAAKASRIISKMDDFSFRTFERQFYQDANTSMDVYEFYNNTINRLKYYGKVGTASNYESSMNSLKKAFPKLSFRDVDPDLLRTYETKLLSERKSISTVGIYLRPLRAIFNEAIADKIISKDHYPFGKRQYQIPSSMNVKKALTLEEIGKIYHCNTFDNTWDEKARDFFMLSYLCNGMNMKDIALLKFQDIDGEFIRFTRAKTKSTSRIGSSRISIFLSNEIKTIIAKWQNKHEDSKNYIFPIFRLGWSPQQERKTIQQFIKMVNKHLNKVASKVGITKHITTYYARHSFATVLKRSGASIDFISESLGHASHKTTSSYLDSFEDESKKNIHVKLLDFRNT